MGDKVELGYSVGAEQIDASVAVAHNTQYCIAEKAVRIVLLSFIGLYVFPVVAVQPFARANP